MPVILDHFTGGGYAAGQQILVLRYQGPGAQLSWLYTTPTPGITDTPLDNPFTTDGAGAYDFYTEAPIKIVALA